MGSKLSIYSLFELTSGWFSTLLGHQSGVDLLSPNDPKSSDDDSFNKYTAKKKGFHIRKFCKLEVRLHEHRYKNFIRVTKDFH